MKHSHWDKMDGQMNFVAIISRLTCPNVLLRQKRDEVLKGTLSYPYRNMAANN